jgi:hypothetical protein
LVLCPSGVTPLQGAGHHQHRLDGPQAPVVMVLGGGVDRNVPSHTGRLVLPGPGWLRGQGGWDGG